jgi:hypothetical protein
MAYDQSLAERISVLLDDQPSLNAKKMFGGIGYLLRGNMACGVHKDYLVVRVGPDQYQAALEQPHTRIFDITGRPMTGWVMVAPEGYQDDTDLQRWMQMGVDFAASLPSK